MIEGEMDRSRMGGYSTFEGSLNFDFTRNEKKNRAHKRIVSVVSAISSESSHLFPWVETRVGEAESAEGR